MTDVARCPTKESSQDGSFRSTESSKNVCGQATTATHLTWRRARAEKRRPRLFGSRRASLRASAHDICQHTLTLRVSSETHGADVRRVNVALSAHGPPPPPSAEIGSVTGVSQETCAVATELALTHTHTLRVCLFV